MSRDTPMVISAIPAGCWDLDLATGTLSLCRKSRALFGLSQDASDRLTESEWTSRFHPDDLEPVRQALTASVLHRAPYAERFRTIHPDGSVQLVLGIGRPLEYGSESCRFVGWNFDVVSTGEMAADWLSAHPEAVSADQFFSLLPSIVQAEDASPIGLSSKALLERAQSILRVRAARERMLGRSAIGEPAFDLLLHLYVQSEQNETSVTSLARAAGIPHSSAMRWTRYLGDKDLVECTESRSDRRATSVQLTPSGRAMMEEFLSAR